VWKARPTVQTSAKLKDWLITKAWKWQQRRGGYAWQELEVSWALGSSRFFYLGTILSMEPLETPVGIYKTLSYLFSFPVLALGYLYCYAPFSCIIQVFKHLIDNTQICNGFILATCHWFTDGRILNIRIWIRQIVVVKNRSSAFIKWKYGIVFFFLMML
jgi:hypothetical protein